MNTIQIKKTGIKELTTLRKLGISTFLETYTDSNTQQDIEKYIADSFNESKMSEELNHPDSAFYIAWEGQNPIGYLKLNTATAQTETQDEQALEIERIYVKASYHGKRVGQFLYEKALEVAQQKQHTYIWLGVWEQNPKAIKFYEKNGFITFGQKLFQMGEDTQRDLMMKKELY